jgi:hypothetical protein
LISRSHGLLLAAALVALGGAGCAVHGPPTGPPGRLPFGLYRGLCQEQGGVVRFRLLLHAAWPDRLHAEISGPVGGSAWIVDAGEGRVAVVDLSRKVVYSGGADADTVDLALGVRASASDLVAALLSGRPLPPPVEMSRRAGEPGALPSMFEVREGSRHVRLVRQKLLRRATVRPIGTGRVPQLGSGFRVEPIENLRAIQGSSCIGPSGGAGPRPWGAGESAHRSPGP